MLRRTAAAGALASRVLAPQSVRVARILGTGVQAYWQARALFSERKFERLLIWSRDREKAVALKEQFAPWLSRVKIEVIGSVKEVVETTEVLVTATTAREPIVRGDSGDSGTGTRAGGPVIYFFSLPASADQPYRCGVSPV